MGSAEFEPSKNMEIVAIESADTANFRDIHISSGRISDVLF